MPLTSYGVLVGQVGPRAPGEWIELAIRYSSKR